MKKYLFLFYVIYGLYVLPILATYQTQRIVILDPSGDAQRTGRRIGDNFERGLTLQCAEKIKEYIESKASHIKIVISRMPGDIVYDLQNASLSNRLDADFFINLNFYHTQDTKPTVFLYQFSYGNDFASCSQGLVLNTYDQAYRINKSMADVMTEKLRKTLMSSPYQSLFTVADCFSLPIKPLMGIVSPSIAIEAGLKSKELWSNYVEPIALGIIEVVG